MQKIFFKVTTPLQCLYMLSVIAADDIIVPGKGQVLAHGWYLHSIAA